MKGQPSAADAKVIRELFVDVHEMPRRDPGRDDLRMRELEHLGEVCWPDPPVVPVGSVLSN